MSRQLLSVLFLLFVLNIFAPRVWGQQTTTVQLPTFHYTTVSTTVSVPDGGTGLLGGIGRASEGSVTRGFPLLSKLPGVNRLSTNRGVGRDVGAMSMTVTPRIINLEEEELRQTGFSYGDWSAAGGVAAGRIAAGGGGAEDPQVARKAAFLSRHVAVAGREPAAALPTAAAETGLPSLAEIQQQNERALIQRAVEAEEHFASAQRAASEGKTGAAKVYYQMALRRADPTLQAKILAGLSALDAGAASSSGMQLADR